MSIFNESSWIDNYKTKYTVPYEELKELVDKNDNEALLNIICKVDDTLEEYMSEFFDDEDIENVQNCICDWYGKDVLSHGKDKIVDLHRIIAINDLNEMNTIDLGLCWAWDFDGAEYYGYNFLDHNKKFIYFKAHTDRDNINWAKSIGCSIRELNEHELRVINEDEIILDKKLLLKE